ncbi:MAG: MarR family transcriptional regulator [Mycobacteriaceae bacterium]|nr:MarR family transcriptional regulator [Mycobacteriaceae bacterium]
MLLLAAAAQVTDAVHTHGFAFVRMAPDGATTAEIAAHLGVTKQAAAQLVDELERKGYVARGPHPTDARARLVTLTDRGWACTGAADAAAAAFLADWTRRLGPAAVTGLRDMLAAVVPPGRVRPSAW